MAVPHIIICFRLSAPNRPWWRSSLLADLQEWSWTGQGVPSTPVNIRDELADVVAGTSLGPEARPRLVDDQDALVQSLDLHTWAAAGTTCGFQPPATRWKNAYAVARCIVTNRHPGQGRPVRAGDATIATYPGITGRHDALPFCNYVDAMVPRRRHSCLRPNAPARDIRRNDASLCATTDVAPLGRIPDVTVTTPARRPCTDTATASFRLTCYGAHPHIYSECIDLQGSAR